MNMIAAVINFYDVNTAAVAGIPAFATTMTDVKTKKTLIDNLNIVAGGSTEGVTLDTNNIRRAMEALALK